MLAPRSKRSLCGDETERSHPLRFSLPFPGKGRWQGKPFPAGHAVFDSQVSDNMGLLPMKWAIFGADSNFFPAIPETAGKIGARYTPKS
jgi:hypothetical protein